MEILLEKDYQVSRWDGGYTRQLFLYPPSGDYQKRDFQVRISSAVIEREISKFTKLPDVKRFLMMLRGKVKLDCGAGKIWEISPCQVITFDGAQEITSYGTGTDMNLMLKGNVRGDMTYLEIEGGQEYRFEDLWAIEKRIVYVICGEAWISGQKIQKDETAIINKEEKVNAIVNLKEETLKICLFHVGCLI